MHIVYKITREMKQNKMRLAGYIARMGKQGHAYRDLVGKPVRKKSLGRPTCRWENNIKMDLKKMGWEGVDCIHMRIRTSGVLL